MNKKRYFLDANKINQESKKHKRDRESKRERERKENREQGISGVGIETQWKPDKLVPISTLFYAILLYSVSNVFILETIKRICTSNSQMIHFIIQTATTTTKKHLGGCWTTK